MLRAAGQLKDLAARAENASPGEWQLMARQFEELKMNMEQIRHALEELGKIKAKAELDQEVLQYESQRFCACQQAKKLRS